MSKESTLKAPIPEELLKELEERFPERCPSIGTPDREIWFYAGQRQLVRFLQEQFRRQNENLLEE
jgi:hypothetical protein